MDVATLARELAEYLVPALPYLTKATDGALEELGKTIGGRAADYAKSLWDKLHPRVEARGALQEVVNDVAATPNDEVARTALLYRLKKLLAEDAELTHDLEAILQDAKNGGVRVILSGDRSVGIVGNVSGGTIITGDQRNERRRSEKE